MTSSSPSLLEQVRSTFPSLDAWGEALAEVHRPAAGSPLAADDEDWPWTRMSQVAVMGLGSARDHLHAVRVLIEARQFSVYAQPTLIRSALIGAAQAVWVLAPDEASVRIERARLLVDYMHDRHGKYLNALLRIDPSHESTRLVANHVAARTAELRDIRSDAGQRGQLKSTSMISEAALAAFEDPGALEVASIWQVTSGAAHGFAWSVLGQPDTKQTGDPDDDGLAEFGAAGGIDRIANSYLCAFHLARVGWDLLHRRSAADGSEGSSSID